MPNLTSPIQYVDGSDHFGNRLRLPRDTMAVRDATFRDHYDPATASGRVHVQREGDRLHERLLQVARPLFYMDEKVVWVFFDDPGDPVWMEVRPETIATRCTRVFYGKEEEWEALDILAVPIQVALQLWAAATGGTASMAHAPDEFLPTPELHEKLLNESFPLLLCTDGPTYTFHDGLGARGLWRLTRPARRTIEIDLPRERIVAELRSVLERFGLKPEGALQSAAVDSAIRAALDAYNTHLAHRSG